MKEYVMGNGAIALGALSAGVNFVSGYPGTPSSEIIETIAKHPQDGLHVEWSINEKAAMEAAAAASMAGARSLVTMKQVGLNVAADPLMSLAYVGVKGGMVIVSADDPGPISSQTEQDTRRFADFCRIPVFDPSGVEEAFEMIQDAFEYSEKYKTPVLFRPTTRVNHAYASVDVNEPFPAHDYEGFKKDAAKWVIFPRLSFNNHGMIEKRNIEIGKDFSNYKYNYVNYKSFGEKVNAGENSAAVISRKAVIATGVSYSYAKEILGENSEYPLIKISTPFPFPEDFVLKALEGIEEVMVFEELSPYVEEQIIKLAGKYHMALNVFGKLSGHVPHNGELGTNIIGHILKNFIEIDEDESEIDISDAPVLPVRPPVLCAGCPHRASFYAVKQAMKGQKTVYCGDIGCYTLGNAKPLDMCDTCLCMGAGITMAQGFYHMEKDTHCFAFVGDSTFFASGITGTINAVYNEANMTLCILDNSTTAMTGHQPHPGTGINMMGNVVDKVNIKKILEGIGLKKIITVDPLDLAAAIAAVKECDETEGVKAIIFKSPCIAISKPSGKCHITDKCINCKKCIRELGCPALITIDGQTTIDKSLCSGCGLCARVCPADAIIVPDTTYGNAGGEYRG